MRFLGREDNENTLALEDFEELADGPSTSLNFG